MNNSISMMPQQMGKIQGLDKRRRLAEALQSQALQPLHGQMVGNVFVPPSWTQGLAKVLQSYQSGSELNAINQEEQNIYQDRQQQFDNAIHLCLLNVGWQR